MGHTILFGITGGIAAYKSLDIIRNLKAEGYDIHVVLTKNARQFVTEVSLKTISENPVATDMFILSDTRIKHIELAKEADMLVVAPATANIIGKFAHGIADDLLSTIFLSTKAPIILAPAMNQNMYENLSVQENIGILKRRGIKIIEPEIGELACGSKGIGRLADPAKIVAVIKDVINTKKVLTGKTVLITAGPTYEHIDPIRYITNRSSGKMGYCIAEAASYKGARTILISGPTNLGIPYGVEGYKVLSSQEMYDMVLRFFPETDIVIMAAAVSDYKPITPVKGKIKKGNERYTLELTQTIDILEHIGKIKDKRIIIGFAAETEDLLTNAKDKLYKKNLDLIVANDVSNPDIGFESDYNKVCIISRDGGINDFPVMRKEEIADLIINQVVKISCQDI